MASVPTASQRRSPDERSEIRGPPQRATLIYGAESVYHQKMNSHLPPIHDSVRLWQGTEEATLRACIAFRKRVLPGWTLSWLRESAAHVFVGELAESALRQAVRANVPEEAQRSVMRGLELLLAFIEKHRWQGKALPPRTISCGALCTELRPIGEYYSHLLNKRFLLALQPRLEDVPNFEQFRIWHSALDYEFCTNSSELPETMIVDLSKNLVSGKRELRELTSVKLPLLERTELRSRLELIASCYKRAIDEVPHLPERQHHPRNARQKELQL